MGSRRAVAFACIVSGMVVACGAVLLFSSCSGAGSGETEPQTQAREDEILAAIEAALADAKAADSAEAAAPFAGPEEQRVPAQGVPGPCVAEGEGRHQIVAGEPLVVLESVSEAHPLWNRLCRLSSRLDELKRSWQQYVDGARVSLAELAARQQQLEGALEAFHADLVRSYDERLAGEREMVEHALADFEQSVRARAEDKVAVEAAQIQSRLEDRIYVEEGRRAREVEALEASIAAEYQPRLMALRLTLTVGRVPRSQREEIEAEVAGIEAEIARRVSDARARAKQELDRFVEQERAAAERELAQVKREAEEEAARSVADERARMTELLEAGSRERVRKALADANQYREKLIQDARESLFQRQLCLSEAVREREYVVLPQITELAAEVERLKERISADVEAAIRMFELQSGRAVRAVRRDDLAARTQTAGAGYPPAGESGYLQTAEAGTDVLEQICRILVATVGSASAADAGGEAGGRDDPDTVCLKP